MSSLLENVVIIAKQNFENIIEIKRFTFLGQHYDVIKKPQVLECSILSSCFVPRIFDARTWGGAENKGKVHKGFKNFKGSFKDKPQGSMENYETINKNKFHKCIDYKTIFCCKFKEMTEKNEI